VPANSAVGQSKAVSAYDTAKLILTRLPGAVLRPQPPADWTGAYPMPSAVAEYYAELGPVDVSIENYGNPYLLPSFSHLWEHQVGYRTHGISGERLSDWDDDWLVIADQGGDPFIFSRSTGSILHAYHGEGVWEPRQYFDSLHEMVTCFAILGEIVDSAGGDFTDEECLIRPHFREAARARVLAFAGPSRVDEIVANLGWSAHR
jgi:hypothetical protein